MKQKFDKNIHEKFKAYFDIKNNPSDIEKWFYKKTEKYLKYIKRIPGLKMVWIWNSIAMNSATSDSDIDLYIVTSPNSMWLNRIIITLFFQILWVRKNEKHHSGRFCLSFFSTTDWMDFSDWKLENDVYLYFWIVYFKPILDYDNTYESFLEKNSSWADFGQYSEIIEENKKYVRYWTSYKDKTPLNSPLPSKDWTRIRGDEKQIDGIFVSNLNTILKKIFLPKTLKHFEEIWKPFGVIINDDLLKFHNGDIREKIKKELITSD